MSIKFTQLIVGDKTTYPKMISVNSLGGRCLVSEWLVFKIDGAAPTVGMIKIDANGELHIFNDPFDELDYSRAEVIKYAEI